MVSQIYSLFELTTRKTSKLQFCPFMINTLRPRQNGRHFPDDICEHIFLNEIIGIAIQILLRFVPKGPIINIAALVQIIAWRRPGDKPLSEPMMASLQTHICVIGLKEQHNWQTPYASNMPQKGPVILKVFPHHDIIVVSSLAWHALNVK